MSLLIVIAVTYWLTARHYKKKFGIKTIQVIEQPEKEETLASETYRRRKTQSKVEFRDE